MLGNWLQPVDIEVQKLEAYQFGRNITIYDEVIPNLKNVNIAIIGIGKEEADKVRASLYALSYRFNSLKIVDLGNVRNESIDFVIPVLQELLASKIFPIIIGHDHQHTSAQYQAYHTAEKLVNLVVIDKTADYTFERKWEEKEHYFLNKILKLQPTHLFNFSLIGYQSHYINPKVLDLLEERSYESVRIGEARRDLGEIEPLIRDADLMSIDISSVKYAEAPGSSQTTPSGFMTEEICKIAHYAGLNDKLSSIGFYGYEPELDQQNQTAQLLAQLVWYVIDGFSNRTEDFPIVANSFVEYVVDFKDSDYQITFWKSTRSDRWWMQVPVKHKEQERHRLIPCSYIDYQLACQSELSERLISAYNRFM